MYQHSQMKLLPWNAETTAKVKFAKAETPLSVCGGLPPSYKGLESMRMRVRESKRVRERETEKESRASDTNQSERQRESRASE